MSQKTRVLLAAVALMATLIGLCLLTGEQGSVYLSQGSHNTGQRQQVVRPSAHKPSLRDSQTDSKKLNSTDTHDQQTQWGRGWHKEEARRMDQPDSDPQATQMRLQRIADHLNPGEIQELKSLVIKQKLSENERNLAFYLLEQSPHVEIQVFQDIAEMRVPPALNHHMPRSGLALVFAALEKIHLAALKDPTQIQRLMEIARNTHEQSVQYLVRELIAASIQGKPYVVGVR